MQQEVYKTFIIAAIAVVVVLMAHNAIAGTAFPVEPIGAASADPKTSNTIDVVAEFIEISPIESTLPAVGDSELNALEVSGISDLSSMNTMLIKSNWKYVAQIVASDPYTLAAGTYKVELFENDKPKGALFFKHSAVNDGMTDGVTAMWDIGNEIPINALYTVKVTKSAINTQGGE